MNKENISIKHDLIIEKSINKKEYIDFYNKKIKTRSELIGAILKFLRSKLMYTQKEVATSIGVAQQTYAGYENGKHEPSIELMIRLADIYKMPMDYITGRFSGIDEDEIINQNLIVEDIIDETYNFYISQKQNENAFLKMIYSKQKEKK